MKRKVICLVMTFLMICSTIVWLPPNQKVRAAGAIYWPVPGHTTRSQRWHGGNAIDISDGSIGGADVIAACGGTVCAIFLCPTQHYPSEGDCHGFGTGLVINGDDGRVYQYAHMQANSIPENVYYGAYVSAGQKIGKVGTTGNSTGNHLHFGISLGNYWNASGINPDNETYIYNSVHQCSYNISITIDATCTTTGSKTYSCSCGKSYTETIAAKGHSYGKKVVAPTTTEKGYTLHTCSRCGYSYKDTYVDIPALNADGWYYCDTLPSDVSSDKYEIQYNNYYEKTQKTSPGSDWTNAGLVKSEWQNSGSTYTSETDLSTSDSRVLVESKYYHFCIPGAGANTAGNYEMSGEYLHYDSIPADWVTVRYLGDDNGHPYYFLYWASTGEQVYCKSGDTCDGSWGTHSIRCKAWYKENTYQNRVKVELYKYTKNSSWVSTKDASATSVKIRYKQKECQHKYTGWTVKKAATAEAAGQETRTCSLCGKVETRNIPKLTTETGKTEKPNTTDSTITVEEIEPDEVELGENHLETIFEHTHIYKIIKTVKPTYQTKGYTLKKCTKCGKTTKSDIKEKLVLKAPTKLTIKSRRKKVILSWKKVTGAVKYEVYLATSKKGKYKKLTTTNKTKYTKKKLKKGKKYYIKVRSYITDGSGQKYYSAYSSIKSVKVK